MTPPPDVAIMTYDSSSVIIVVMDDDNYVFPEGSTASRPFVEIAPDPPDFLHIMEETEILPEVVIMTDDMPPEVAIMTYGSSPVIIDIMDETDMTDDVAIYRG